jgi:hypothetical protein
MGLVLVGLALISSCQTKGLKFPDVEAVPVLNAVLISGEVAEASISMGVPLNMPENTQPTVIKDAKVALYEENNFIELLEWIETSKIYRGTHIIKANTRYKITAEIADLPTLEGETFIPNSPKLNVLSFKDTLHNFGSTSAQEGYFAELEVIFAAQNQGIFPHASAAYYRILPNQSITGGRYLTNSSFWGTSTASTFVGNYNLIGSDAIQPRDIRSFGFLIKLESLFVQRDSIYNYVDVLNNDMYLYLNQLNQLRPFSSGNDPYIEPPTLISNVKNGAGIVGGVARGSYSIVKPR